MRMLLVAVIGMMATGCVTVGAGQAAVVWHARSGTDPQALSEGFHTLSAYDEVALYDLRTQQRNEQLQVLAANGLSLTLDTTIRYHVVANEVSALHRQIGPDYYNVILGPVLRSQARRVVGRYTPEEIYSTKREVIEREMREAVENATAGKHVQLEAILVRNVALPDMIQKAIVDKLAEEQSSLKMKYVIQREAQEAERKKIEAHGIALFQDIISSRLTEATLRWKQIDVQERLALSNNAKVIMMGNCKDAPMLLESTVPAR